ncbi:MAG: aldo/keto reductase [Thermoleophilia bacterium]
MQYRDFGRLDFKPSALGFGTMRLPVHKDADGRPDFKRIDYPAATAMLRRAVDGGVNYVDTAYVYHEEQSEVWLGEALTGGYREKVKLATKMPVWKVARPGDFDRLLGEQLQRLQTDSVDYYLLHSLDDAHWQAVLEQGQLAAAGRALADGRIGHLGFSFHGEYPLFEEVLAASDLWEFCQIQLNYMDEEYQAGRRGLELAAGRGLGVIVMEPVRGGMLARNLPPRVEAVWAESPVPRSPVEWGLQWVWSLPEVSLVLSGMSTLQHVEDNLVYAGRSRPGLLTAEELALVARVRDLYRELSPVPCTACRYCLPCPQGVAIPEILELYNGAHMYGEPGRQRMFYTWLDEGARAAACTACGECESACPQGIAVASWMEKAQAFLGGCA